MSDPTTIAATLIQPPDGAAFAGVFARATLDEIARCVEHSGWIVRRTSFDLMNGGTIMGHWAELLGFPDYYGNNWNAFDECFSDREFTPKAPTLLIVEDAGRVVARTPIDLLGMLEQIATGRAGSNLHDPMWEFHPFSVLLSFSNSRSLHQCLKPYPNIRVL
jgi:hypothetical protein